MKSRESIDPELHIIRTCCKAAEGRERTELESARFNIFAAFESGDPEKAKRWIVALKAALLVWDDNRGGELRGIAADALKRIEAALK